MGSEYFERIENLFLEFDCFQALFHIILQTSPWKPMGSAHELCSLPKTTELRGARCSFQHQPGTHSSPLAASPLLQPSCPAGFCEIEESLHHTLFKKPSLITHLPGPRDFYLLPHTLSPFFLPTRNCSSERVICLLELTQLVSARGLVQI